MKIRCESCNKKFDPRKHDGVCPYCGAWTSVGSDGPDETSPAAADPWDLPQQSDALPEDEPDESTVFESVPEAQPAGPLPGDSPAGQAYRPTGSPQPAPRRGCSLLGWGVFLFVLMTVIFFTVPPLLESRATARAIEQDRVTDLSVVTAENGLAVASPFTYQLVSAGFVSYDGVWPMPENSRLLRIELAVSMSGDRPEWDPTDPYLRLEDGSYRMAIYGYDLEDLFPEDAAVLSAFPYDVYRLETPSKTASCVFYYLVPQDAAPAAICFEQFAQGDYEPYLTQVTELPLNIAEEVSAE